MLHLLLLLFFLKNKYFIKRHINNKFNRRHKKQYKKKKIDKEINAY